ncbi:MAG: hypothetical protein KC917_07060, partial [Candidatus Omnitrophica bacterium]|nr:hypothetical protein [Candidatus Omnitrophota bacterium]
MPFWRYLIVLTVLNWITVTTVCAEILITGGGGSSAVDVILDNGVDPPTRDSMTHGPYTLTFDENGFNEFSGNHQANAQFSPLVFSQGKSGGRATFKSSSELAIQDFTTQVVLTSRTSFGSVHSGTSTFSLEFEITERPAMMDTRVTVTRTFGGESEFTGRGRLVGASSNQVFDFVVSGSAEDNPNVMQFIDNLTLQPDQYTLTVECEGHLTLPIRETPVETNTQVIASGLLTIIQEAESGPVVWTGGDGNYNEASNWDLEQVPTAGDTARFHESDISPVDVTFGEEELSSRVIVSDDVRFLSGTYSLGEGTETEPALVVSPTSESSSSLTLVNHQLNAGYAVIAQDTGSDGTLNVINGGSLNCSKRLTVGESGGGVLNIGFLSVGTVMTDEFLIAENAQSFATVEVEDDANTPGSEIVAATTSIGYFGQGTLTITDAQIETGQTSVGRFFGSSGLVKLNGTDGDAEWTCGAELRIGDEATGEVRVSSGTLQSLVGDPVYIGYVEGSTGCLILEGEDSRLDTFGRVDVGFQGDGTLIVDGGAQASIDGTLHIGGVAENEGRGRVDIKDGIPNQLQSRIQAGLLEVGVSGRGILNLLDTASLGADAARFGTEAGGDAIVQIRRSSIIDISGNVTIGQNEPAEFETRGKANIILDEVDDEFAILEGNQITLHEGSAIIGNGIVCAEGGFTNEGGTLTPSVDVDEILSKQGATSNTLTIQGNYTMTSGVLEIAASGLGLGEHGIIEVTGTADIQSASIHFVFQDGFLPKTDDEIPFFMGEGDLTVETLAFTYEGAAPGFQFDVMVENGMLKFKTLNDTQPTG